MARSTSKFKKKPAVPFGDFMLPILGVIALGIVVMGIRMLWSPSVPKSVIVPQPRVTQSHNAVQTPSAKAEVEEETAEPAQDTSSKEEVSDVIVAHPKSESGKEVVARPRPKNTTSEKSSGTQVVARPQPKPQTQSKPQQAAQPKQQPAVQKAQKEPINKNVNINKSQFIVQCGSFSDSVGANAAVSTLKKIGYVPVIRKVDVRGKTYYRVVVAGGDREHAEAIQADIKQKTKFPTLVRSNSN